MIPEKIIKDSAGNPIVVPRGYAGSYEQFGGLVAALDANCCSFPAGKRLDPRSKNPCRRPKICEDGCEYHAARAAGKKMRYAKSLPKSTRKKFLLNSIDDELLNITHDVALFAARKEELQLRLDTGESSSAWRSLHNKYTEFRTAQANVKAANEIGDAEEAAQWMAKSGVLINEMGKLIHTGNRNEETWAQILVMSQQLANLKTLETRRKRESGSVMTVDEVLKVVQKLQDVVCDEVKEEGPRTRIAIKLATMFGIATVASSEPEQGTTPTPIHTTSDGLSVDYYLNRSFDSGT